MFAKAAAIIPLAALAACSTASTPSPARPVFEGAALAKDCVGRDGWSDPALPGRIHGSTYYVGTCGITALLIDSGEGLILIDGATEEAGPAILANVRKLGFDPKDIKYLLASHEHFDHVAGLAAIQQASGAPVRALPPAIPSLRGGTSHPSDPQTGELDPYPPLTTGEPLVDGQAITLGSLSITPVSTPAHSLGSTSYHWKSCEDGTCVTIAYMDSLSTPTVKFRFADHPDQVKRVQQGLDKASQFRCEILITPHPSASNLFARLGGEAPLVDASSCPRYVRTAQQNFETRLAKEKE